MSTLQELKAHEGERVYYTYRGKIRPFILRAVQTSPGLIHGQYEGNLGEVRLDFDYEGNREWPGFWTRHISRILLHNTDTSKNQ